MDTVKKKLKRLSVVIVQDIVDALDIDLDGAEGEYQDKVFARLSPQFEQQQKKRPRSREVESE